MKNLSKKDILCGTSMMCVFVSTVSTFVGLFMKNISLCFASIFAGYISLMLFFTFVFGVKDEEDSCD